MHCQRRAASERGPGAAHGIGLGLGEQGLADGEAVVGLGHGAHELARDVHEHVRGQIEVRVLQVRRDPARQLVPLVRALVPLVRKHLRRTAEPYLSLPSLPSQILQMSCKLPSCCKPMSAHSLSTTHALRHFSRAPNSVSPESLLQGFQLTCGGGPSNNNKKPEVCLVPPGLLHMQSHDVLAASHEDVHRGIRWFIEERGPHHQAIVCFGADDTADALRSLPHCIEREVIALLYLERLPQILQPRPDIMHPTAHQSNQGASLLLCCLLALAIKHGAEQESRGGLHEGIT